MQSIKRVATLITNSIPRQTIVDCRMFRGQDSPPS